MAIALSHKPRLRREIVITLMVKFAIIYALWYLFFSQPVDEDLAAPDVADTLFGQTAVTSPPSTTSVIKPKEKTP